MKISRPILVTGCSSGIGHAAALALARSGLPTWASARRMEELSDLKAAGCNVIELDVTSKASCQRAVDTILAKEGGIEAIINNAGYTLVGPLEETPLASVQRLFDTNVLGVLRLCQLVLPAMRTQGRGTIINIGSVAGVLTPPGGGAYSMSKYALEALSDALRFEVRSFGVRVVLLQPGGVRTRLMDKGMLTMPPDDGHSPYAIFKKNFGKMVAHAHRENAREIITPEAVARVVVKVVTARHPRARYRLGLPAHIAPLVRRWVGDRVWDLMLQTQVATR